MTYEASNLSCSLLAFYLSFVDVLLLLLLLVVGEDAYIRGLSSVWWASVLLHYFSRFVHYLFTLQWFRAIFADIDRKYTYVPGSFLCFKFVTTVS